MNDDNSPGIQGLFSSDGQPSSPDPKPGHCPACLSPIRAGIRFCPLCGAAAGDGPRPARPSVRWLSVGVLMVLVPTIMGYWKMTGDRYWLPPSPAEESPRASSSKVDLTTMSARAAADRLFDRVMRAVVANDVGEVQNFLPMAVAAYRRVDSLGSDGAFHLSTLLRVGSDHHGALMVAQAALDRDPDHVLVLSEAALGALALGDSAAARSYSRHLLTVYTAQVRRDIDDYVQHRDILPTLQERAGEIVRGARADPAIPHVGVVAGH